MIPAAWRSFDQEFCEQLLRDKFTPVVPFQPGHIEVDHFQFAGDVAADHTEPVGELAVEWREIPSFQFGVMASVSTHVWPSCVW